jgi:hypothetical protein
MQEVCHLESQMPNTYQGNFSEAALVLEDVELEFHAPSFLETVEDMESCRNVKIFRITMPNQ